MNREDIILKEFFRRERWESAIDKGVGKDIRKDVLIDLCSEQTRLRMAAAMRNGTYRIAPPHTARIPKDNGDFRTVYVNEPIDRIVLSIANDLLFDLMPDMIHPSCKSYQRGIGCGRVVTEASRRMTVGTDDEVMGWKSDLSKYFDSVPVRYIDQAFDRVEQAHGASALITVLRHYYHCDLYFDEDNRLQSGYQSLKQGCAVASWLANVLLYDIDKELSGMQGYYVRYSDDMLYIGADYDAAMQTLCDRLAAMQMKLNPKKVEYLTPQRWFKFLGYSIKGASISLSGTRIKTFQREVESRTLCRKGISMKQAVSAVNRYLYKGDGRHSWATQVLPVVNVQQDIDCLNLFVMDCLRAVHTGKRKVGGLGYEATKRTGCISRGTGRHVSANRRKTAATIDGYLTLGCMQRAIKTRKAVYECLVRSL